MVGVLLGLGIGQVVQFQEVMAESQEDSLSQLAAELDALKTKHKNATSEMAIGITRTSRPNFGGRIS